MITVIKATGIKEPFSEEKLRMSIRRAGIPEDIQDQVVAHINTKLYNDIPTSQIYRHIGEFLTATHPLVKGKYSLKQAIMDLGPTGYPFEDFIAHLLNAKGYTSKVRQILSGKCISHEIDVVAQKEEKHIMVEAKFHNMVGIKTNVHVALYTKARFDDVKERNNLSEGWLVTNTSATLDAISYAKCSGLTIISWNYPEGESLRDIVQQSGLTPITALTNLSQSQKQQLAQTGVVTTKYLLQHAEKLSILNLSEDKKQTILNEAEYLSKTVSN